MVFRVPTYLESLIPPLASQTPNSMDAVSIPVNAGTIPKDFEGPEEMDFGNISWSAQEYGPGSYVSSKTSPFDRALLEEGLEFPSPADFFRGSENFTINDGKFNSSGRDMHTSTVNHNDNSTTTITINNCVCSWNNSDPKENHNLPPEPPSGYSVFTHSSLSEPPTDCSPLPLSPPKCHRCWSTSIFIPVVYYPSILPGIMYPVSWICPYFIPTLTGWFNAPASPYSTLSYGWPGWYYPNYNSRQFIMIGPGAAIQEHTSNACPRRSH
ncbi:hypothetical protein GYMLUDRAFT_1006909 [Collybiopsis luxurians FD-317 M1]|uniref:Uncharacterized protein n=1 Tax=Collybiopsis luxurians FD-317 M1 TaxID=944289 RepID=A0A0D0C640_9AGAR|nr:hypothetical protein GYMLUDRAFT_1006909 [Collybiopsis luxurians FD-317 M1]